MNCQTYILTSTSRKLLSAPAMHSTKGSFLSVRDGNQSSSNTRVPGNCGCKREFANGSGESYNQRGISIPEFTYKYPLYKTENIPVGCNK